MICETGPHHLGEFGVYELDADVVAKHCSFVNSVEPTNPNLAILYWFLIISHHFLIIVGIYNIVTFVLRKGYYPFCRNLLKRSGSFWNLSR